MSNGLIWLVLSELFVILFIVVLKLWFNRKEDKKIDKILSFMEKHKTKESTDKFKECLEIIKRNQDNIKN